MLPINDSIKAIVETANTILPTPFNLFVKLYCFINLIYFLNNK